MKTGEETLDALVLLCWTAAYCLPAMIAFVRGHYALRRIMLLDIGLGWAVIPWIASLIWACSRPDRPRRGPMTGSV